MTDMHTGKVVKLIIFVCKLGRAETDIVVQSVGVNWFPLLLYDSTRGTLSGHPNIDRCVLFIDVLELRQVSIVFCPSTDFRCVFIILCCLSMDFYCVLFKNGLRPCSGFINNF